MRTTVLLAAAGLACAAAPATAQYTRFILLDRPGSTNNRLFSIDDQGQGSITSEATQVAVYWSSLNGAGTPILTTPTALSYRPSDGALTVGDSGSHGVYLFRDWNQNNDAQAPGESAFVAGPTNLSGIVLNPLGIAFDAAGNIYVSNSGNGAGAADAIYRLTDLDSDGAFNSAGEITEYVGTPFFGGGNGAYVPAEMVIDSSSMPFVGYWKDSGASTAGVYRFSDANGNGRADDSGETTVFINSTNASGVPVPSGGLTLALDATRTSSLYFAQISSSVRQLVRAQDLNGNGNAQDAGEAAVVWATSEALVINEIVSLPDGRIALTDSNRHILMLTPTGSTFNGYSGTPFTTGNGYTIFYTSSNNPTGNPPTPGSFRQLVAVPRACPANCDGSTSVPLLNVSDFTCFLQKFAQNSYYANCDSSTSSPLLNVTDFTCFLQKFAQGCP